jgi:hypothetical protein
MKRINSGYFSAAYYTTNRKNVILFSIDPLKQALCDFVQHHSYPYFPQIELIAVNTDFDDTIRVYRMEKLVTVDSFYGHRMSLQRKSVADDYEELNSALWDAGIVNGKLMARTMTKHERFERWMDKVMNDKHLAKYEEALREQFDFYYGLFNEDLAFDFHSGNLSVRPRQHTLVFSDIYGLNYLCDDDSCRIAYNYPDRLLRSIYSE